MFHHDPPSLLEPSTEYSLLHTFYEHTHKRDRLWILFSIVLTALGGILAITSAFISMMSSSLIILTGGVFLIAIAIFLFRRTREASKKVDSYYTEKLCELHNLSQLIKLTSSMPDSEIKKRLLEKTIIQNFVPIEQKELLKHDSPIALIKPHHERTTEPAQRDGDGLSAV